MRRSKLVLLLTFALALVVPVTAGAADPMFDQSRLHECKLELDPADWSALRANFQTNQYYAANLTVDGETVKQVGIRSRGAGSRSGEKPGLKLDFNKYVSGQEFHGYKSVVLDNVTQDPSMMRELLANSIFESVGIAAPQISFCRLTINTDYWGLYTLIEAVSKPFLKARLGEESGTLFDYEYTTDYRFGYLGDGLAPYSPVPFEPQTNESKLDTGLSDFIKAINQTPQSGYAAAMESYIDVKKFLTHVAVENACAEYDGVVGQFGLNNFYLYQYGGQKKFVFIPWDKDTSFQAAEWPVQQRMDSNEFTKRLMLDPAMKSYYESEVKRIASNFVTTAFLNPKIDQFASMIRPSVAADTHKPFSLADFEATVAGLKSIAAARAGNVAAQVP
ncbi:MAG TPA: CotH kinase family protein [Vicinamibacteria bacterium]|nr:CotH kinase family protein [Vicinamibacteria bacterium]